jgi:hypothetical protein
MDGYFRVFNTTDSAKNHISLCSIASNSINSRFFSVDARERLKYYMMCSIKKPVRLTIRLHVCHMETLIKYLGMLPMIKNSPMAVASTELGNVPFNEATHSSIILSHLPVAWRNQYNLTHKTIPESPRAMLLDLENIEKMQVETTRKPRPARPRLLQPRLSSVCPGNGRIEEVPIKEPPRKAVLLNIASGARQQTAHSRPTKPRSAVVEKDGSPKDRLVKPFHSATKPWKKTGGGESCQMAYLMERLIKLEKKHKKSKKHGKKCSRDSSDSDSDSD